MMKNIITNNNIIAVLALILVSWAGSAFAQDVKEKGISFTCDAGTIRDNIPMVETSFNQMFRYKVDACYTAAVDYAKAYSCNKMDNFQQVTSNCVVSCGHPNCVDVSLWTTVEDLPSELQPEPTVANAGAATTTTGGGSYMDALESAPVEAGMDGVWHQATDNMNGRGFISQLSVSGNAIKSCDWQNPQARTIMGKVVEKTATFVRYKLNPYPNHILRLDRRGGQAVLKVETAPGAPPSKMVRGTWQSNIGPSTRNAIGENNGTGNGGTCS
ncbi:MAG: hypothetical protein P8P98_04420 [Emcibacteraceae bacterium]|nr:hypothetical protein [Emcibacteraceae bacterium]MDG1858917.1 hypothetical protein [Emcibacteraceae bacterium]